MADRRGWLAIVAAVPMLMACGDWSGSSNACDVLTVVDPSGDELGVHRDVVADLGNDLYETGTLVIVTEDGYDLVRVYADGRWGDMDCERAADA